MTPQIFPTFHKTPFLEMDILYVQLILAPLAIAITTITSAYSLNGAWLGLGFYTMTLGNWNGYHRYFTTKVSAASADALT